MKYISTTALFMACTMALLSHTAASSDKPLFTPMDEECITVVYGNNKTGIPDDGLCEKTSYVQTTGLRNTKHENKNSYIEERKTECDVTADNSTDALPYYDGEKADNKNNFKIGQILPHLKSYESRLTPQKGLFFKNKNLPIEKISVYDLRADNSYGKITACVAQGILNQKKAGVYLVFEDHHQTQFEDVYGQEGKSWHLLKDEFSKSEYSGLGTLIKDNKDKFTKFVLWDPQKEWTWCLAQMICAQQRALPVTAEIKDFLNNELHLNLACEDITDKWKNKQEAYQWAIDNLAEGCHKYLSFSAGLRSDYLSGPWKIYDYAAASKGFVFFLNSSIPEESDMIKRICEKMDYQPGSSTMGYGTDNDGDGLNNATNPYNVGFMVSDYYANGSFWCSFPNKSFQQRKGQAIEAHPGKIYVSLIWSDGDNIQFGANQMYNMFKHAKGRGMVPVGYTMASSLQELNPKLLEFFYKNLTPNDELLAGPSGFQFIYGDKYNENNFEKWLELNNKWLTTAGFHTVCLWNTTNKERFGEYMKTCGLQGVFDGFNNNKERYERGNNGEGIVCVLQGAHCWNEGDVFNDLIKISPDNERPIFHNVYLIAASYGGTEGYERLIRELQRLESHKPDTFEFLLPMDLCATLKDYIEKHNHK